MSRRHVRAERTTDHWRRLAGLRRRPMCDPRVESDVRWLFAQSDSAMGLRSNFEAMVAGAPAERLPPPDPMKWTTTVKPHSKHSPRWHEYTDRELRAADRANRIWHALRAMPPREAQVLLRAFSADHSLTTWWGCVGALVEGTKTARAAYPAKARKPLHAWLEGLAKRARAAGDSEQLARDRVLFREIQREAEGQLDAACETFLRHWN